MERSFLALKNAKAREAYVEAELINGLSHQIRILRQQRGLTQKQFAEKLGMTQTTVSRLEDPAYGRYSMRTLLALSNGFGLALFVRFMPFSKFIPATWDTRPKQFEALPYEEEAPFVQFYTEEKHHGAYGVKLIEQVSSESYGILKSESSNRDFPIYGLLEKQTYCEA